MGRIQVRDVISNSGEAHAGNDMSYSEVNDLIDEWLPRRGDNSRIFQFITRELKLTADGISEISEPYTCHSCFGEHDENGFYK